MRQQRRFSHVGKRIAVATGTAKVNPTEPCEPRRLYQPLRFMHSPFPLKERALALRLNGGQSRLFPGVQPAFQMMNRGGAGRQALSRGRFGAFADAAVKHRGFAWRVGNRAGVKPASGK